MLMGYMRVSKADGSQVLDLQRDALLASGAGAKQMYEDGASGTLNARTVLMACLKALRAGDTPVVWKLDRLGRSLRHLVNTIYDLIAKGVGFKVLSGHGTSINTTTPEGKLMFGIFATLAEFERALVSGRIQVRLAAARTRGRKGRSQYKIRIPLFGLLFLLY